MLDFLSRIEQTQFSIWIRESNSIWAFPMLLFVHTLGMSVVAGLNAMLDLVLLGLGPNTSIKPLERLYPLMWAGFWVNAITGTVLLYGDAVSKLTAMCLGVTHATASRSACLRYDRCSFAVGRY